MDDFVSLMDIAPTVLEATHPDQVRNAAADSGYAKVLRELTDRMMKELRDTGDPRVIGGGSTFDRKPFVDPTFVPPPKKKTILKF